jgi:hypothetical protein
MGASGISTTATSRGGWEGIFLSFDRAMLLCGSSAFGDDVHADLPVGAHAVGEDAPGDASELREPVSVSLSFAAGCADGSASSRLDADDAGASSRDVSRDAQGVSVLGARFPRSDAAWEVRDPLRERVRDDAIAQSEHADGASRGGAVVDAPTDESVEPGLVEEAWRRFSPTVILPHKRQARTWADGKGGQCKLNVAGDSDLCKKHYPVDNWKKLGRVTGPILDSGKLQEFLSAEQRRQSALGGSALKKRKLGRAAAPFEMGSSQTALEICNMDGPLDAAVVCDAPSVEPQRPRRVPQLVPPRLPQQQQQQRGPL